MRRALTEWLSGHGLISSVGASSMDTLINTLISSKKDHRLSAGSHYVVIDANTVCFQHADTHLHQQVLPPAYLKLEEQVILPNGARIQAKLVKICADLRVRIGSGKVDSNKEAFLADQGESSFNIRSWQEGDYFLPLGAPGRKKNQRLVH
jgi:hypothetical protein